MADWAYYNENDSFAAAWLNLLIIDGHIAPGYVDQRSIVDVQPEDLKEFVQCHFFAGIGGWSYALRLAGVSDDEPVWTGSCPCQPFSQAGQRKGTADKRHLWPEFARLIRSCHPATIFGEQVASKDGREWLAGVFADLEDMGYSRAGADLCAAGIGAPHIRQRLYWVADTDGGREGNGDLQRSREHGQQPKDSGVSNGLGNTDNAGLQGRSIDAGEHAHQWTPWASGKFIPCADGKTRRVEPTIFPLANGVPNRMGTLRGSGNAIVPQVAALFIEEALEAIRCASV